MASAVVGALRVNLGLNSAQFSDGLKNSQRGLARFGSMARGALLGVAAAGTAAAAGLAVAVKGSIDHADALSKTAQSVGTTTENLSRLEWAAKLSGASLNDLSGSMRKLSQNMFEVSEGRGAQAASSLEALGVAVVDSNGNLRDSGEVLRDIAQRFSNLEDGATKTALAMNIFGRSGTTLIPLLNQGRSGLAAMADESDRLGLTISTNTGRAAEAFNDSLTRLHAGFQGIVNEVMVQVLPAMNDLTATLSSEEAREAFATFASLGVSALNAIIQGLVRATGAATMLQRTLSDGPAGMSDQELKSMMGAGLDQVSTLGISVSMQLADMNARGGDTVLQEWIKRREAELQESIDGGAIEPPTLELPVQLSARSSGGSSANDNSPVDLMQGLNNETEELTGQWTELSSIAQSAMNQFVDALADGKLEAQELNDILGDVLNSLLKMTLNSAFGSITGGGNPLAGIFGGGSPSYVPGFGAYGTFASGGYTGSMPTTAAAGIVHGQEYVLNAAATRRVGVGNLNAINAGGGIGGGTNVIIENHGAQVEHRTERAPDGRDIERFVVSTVNNNADGLRGAFGSFGGKQRAAARG